LYRLYQTDRFNEEFAFAFAPIDWRSDKADRQRSRWRVLGQGPGTKEKEAGDSGSVERDVQELLATLETGSPELWWQIDRRLLFDGDMRSVVSYWDADISQFPSWQACSLGTQTRIVDAALPFLQCHEPRTEYMGTDIYYVDNNAAYRALVLLLTEREEAFDSISSDEWQKLGPVIMGLHPGSSGSNVPFQGRLLERAKEHGFAPGPWIVQMARAEDAYAYYLTPVLNEVCSTSSSEELTQLADSLISCSLPPAAMIQAVKTFYEIKYPPTFDHAQRVATTLVGDSDRVGDLERLLVTILEHLGKGEWARLSSIIDLNDELFGQVFLSFGHWHHDASSFGFLLEEFEVAELYSKLVKVFPHSEDIPIIPMHAHMVTDRESIGQWRDDLLRSLTARGTWEAVRELRKLAAQLPHIDWLMLRIAEAEEQVRRATWEPTSLDELKALVHSREARVINTPKQLQDVVMESLGRLQAELSAETPLAIDLWNGNVRDPQGTPKDELSISYAIKRFLDRDLKDSEIITNREVENRPGHENDIYVQCMNSITHDVITVVCEVKGCWNRDLYKDMARQLHHRYMLKQGHTHGVYAVAYFDCDRWDVEDRRSRHKVGAHSFDDLRNR
jgi:hypothetical protein